MTRARPGGTVAGSGIVVAAGLLLLSACGERAAPGQAEQPATLEQPRVAAALPAAAAPANGVDNPLLRSEAVKDAIHRALTTGRNQRWQDGDLSGYAVPSTTTLANGCRTVRYTVDQRPNDPMMTINACEGSR